MEDDLIDPQPDNATPAPTPADAPVEPPKTPRELAMEQVVASRKAVEAQELEQHRRDLKNQGLLVEDPPTAEGEDDDTSLVGDAGDDDEVQRRLQQEQEQAQPKVVEDLNQTLVKIKVDGQERLVSLAELVTNAQKNAAADVRLQEASRLLQEAKQQAQQVATQPPEQTEQKNPDKAEKAGQDSTQQVKEFLAAMFQGDEDRATELLSGLVKGSPPPAETAPSIPDPDEIAAQVEASLERRSALKQFATAYPEILKDQDLSTLTDMKLRRRLEAGESFADAIMSVGEEVYLKSGHKTPAAAEGATLTTTPAQSERLERKKAADSIRGRNASAATTREAPATPASVIAEMKAARERGRWNGGRQ